MTNNVNEPLDFSKTPDENTTPPVVPPTPSPYGAPTAYNPPVAPQQAYDAYGNPQQPVPQYQTYAQNVNMNSQAKSNAFALVSFIAGVSQPILSFIFGPLISIVAIIFGHIALSQIKKTGEQGHVFALIGLITGYVGFGLSMLLLLFWIVLTFSSY